MTHERLASQGITLIAAERRRQVEVLGWTAEHDSNHEDDELARAAAIYALPPDLRELAMRQWSMLWPYGWARREDIGRIRQLVVAGALIAAEIDRLLAVQE